jgi:hypothetical protein
MEEAKQFGSVGWGPDFCLTGQATDPLRKPEEFALIIDSIGFLLAAELAAVYPRADD